MLFKNRDYSILPQVRGAIASSLIAFNTGCLVGLPATLIPQLENEENPDLRTDFKEASWIASIYLIGGLPASLIGGYLSNLLGRRGLSLAISVPLLVSWIILATSNSLYQVVIARLVSALAVSSAHPSMGVFVSEISHPELRGSLGATPSIFLALGITNIYLLGWLLPWRTASWVCTIPPVILLLSFWSIPESPYWLAHTKQFKKAEMALQWYRGRDADISAELEEILKKKTGVQDKPHKQEKQSILKSVMSDLRVLGSRRFLKPFSISGVIYILAQWTGVSTMVFYMTHIFRESGSTIDPMMAPVAVAGIRVVTACVSAVVLSFAPRKHLFCGCALVIAISAFSLATCSMYLDSSILPLTAIIAMFVGHSLGVVPVCQLIAAEVFPTDIRTLSTGICVSLATLANAFNAEFYHFMLHHIGFSGTFWLYSCVGLTMAVHAWFTIPDTRNMSLAKIESTMAEGSDKLEETHSQISIIGSPLMDKPSSV